jgi:dihydrofolate reductase
MKRAERRTMGKISVFNHVTADGFFAGPNGEIDWFKVIKKDEEWERYTHGQATSGSGMLMFGRATYEMMKSFWPTPEAIRDDPAMAKAVNTTPKIVFSRTLAKAEEGPNWINISLLKEIKPEEILGLKEKEEITILGSGTIVRQLANLGLIDELNLVVVPYLMGAGKPLFKDVRPTNLELLEARTFKNGIVLLRYQPEK